MGVDTRLTSDLGDAFSLLTRLPVPSRRAPAGRAVWAYPVVGLVVGAAGGAVDLICLWVGMTATVAAIWAVAGQILLTGGLHEDGLADTADGFGAHADAARKLAVMRDSRIGAFGAMALLIVLGVRVAAIAGHPGWPAMLALGAAGASGRAGLVVVLRVLNPARSDGLAAALNAPPAAAVALAVVVAVGADLALGLRVVIAAALAGFTVALVARRHIGGYTGDVLGACEQVIEAAVLSTIV